MTEEGLIYEGLSADVRTIIQEHVKSLTLVIIDLHDHGILTAAEMIRAIYRLANYEWKVAEQARAALGLPPWSLTSPYSEADLDALLHKPTPGKKEP